jgi:hypothetical protein
MLHPGLCRMNQDETLEGAQGAGLVARQPFNMRHSPESLD